MISVQNNQNFRQPVEPNPSPIRTPQLMSRSHPAKRAFSPVLGNTLVIKEDSSPSTKWGVTIYNQKYNMIIVSHADNTIRFYDADTLLPLEEREELELESSLDFICYSPEIDTYLLWCLGREVYTYNASTEKLEKLDLNVRASLLSIIFINPTTYAFVPLSGAIFIKNLENYKTVCFRLKNEASYPLQNVTKGYSLASGLANGSVVIFRIDRLPKISIICSVQAYQIGKAVTSIEKAKINKKECLVTYGRDGVITIWHMVKGAMRRLRNIIIQGGVSRFVYVEEYKMLAITSKEHANSIKFMSLISGKVECILDLQMKDARNLFLMEGKGSVGVLGEQASRIKIVKLGGE